MKSYILMSLQFQPSIRNSFILGMWVSTMQMFCYGQIEERRISSFCFMFMRRKRRSIRQQDWMLYLSSGRIQSIDRSSLLACTLSQKWCQQYLSQGAIFFYLTLVYKSSKLTPSTTVSQSTIGLLFSKSSTILNISFNLRILFEFYLNSTTYSGVK